MVSPCTKYNISTALLLAADLQWDVRYMYKPQINAVVIRTDVVNMNLITILIITQITRDLNSMKNMTTWRMPVRTVERIHTKCVNEAKKKLSRW